MVRVSQHNSQLETPSVVFDTALRVAPSVILESAGNLAVIGAEVSYGAAGAVGITVKSLQEITSQYPDTAIVWFQTVNAEIEVSPVISFENSGLVLDMNEGVVLRDNSDIGLTHTEFKLAAFLMHRKDVLQDHRDLRLGVWGHTYCASSETVRAHVSRLRSKLGESAWVIHSKKGIGYKFTDTPAKNK